MDGWIWDKYIQVDVILVKIPTIFWEICDMGAKENDEGMHSIKCGNESHISFYS